jgi:hypothetical protein
MDAERKMIDVDCNLCGGAEKELLFDKDGFRHVRCRDCGLVYVTPRLSDHIGQQKILWDERDGRLDNIEQVGA